MMAEWDWQANAAEGLFPDEILARGGHACHWVCREHEAGDPDGHWPGHPHRWVQEPRRRADGRPDCRWCRQSEVCPATSLRTTHPNLCDPAVWDYAKNDERGDTPDNVSHGHHGKVSWLCPAHGPFEAEIRVRVRGHGCRKCGDETSAAKALESEKRKARERRAIAREVRLGKAGDVLPFARQARASDEPVEAGEAEMVAPPLRTG